MSTERKWILVAAVVAFLLTAAYVVKLAGRPSNIDREIARIRAEGSPVCAADLAGKPIPDSENAAGVYERAFKLLELPYYQKADDVFCRLLDPRERVRDPGVWRQAATTMAGCTGVLALAQKAAAMPKCRFPVDWSKGFDYTPRYQYLVYLRALARLLCTRAMLQARAGDTSGALESIALAVRASNSLKDEPTRIGALIRVGMIMTARNALIEVADLGRVREADARQCANTLAGVDLTGSFANALKGDRALGIIEFDFIRNGAIPKVFGGEQNTKITRTIQRVFTGFAGGSILRRDEEYYLGKIRKQIKAAALPYRLVEPSLRTDPLSDMPKYALLSSISLYIPLGEWVSQDRGTANLAGDRIFLGLLAYHDRFGAYPVSLDDLKKLDWQLPNDPFSGKPFVYRRQKAGFVLYSIGDDLKDNGGIERNGERPGDIVWSMP